MEVSLRKEGSDRLALLKLIYEMDKDGKQATLWSIMDAAKEKECRIETCADPDRLNNMLKDMAIEGLITIRLFEHLKDGSGISLTIALTPCGTRALEAIKEPSFRRNTC